MSDFNIDNLKNTWQNQKIKPKYNSEEILKMLNKKSRNYVKYIYWISLAELILFFGITIFYIFNGGEYESFYKLIEKLGIKKTPIIEENFEHVYLIFKIISIIIGGYFVFRFYQLKNKIHYEENLKTFISSISSFRKTVKLFIILNILIVIIYMAIGFAMINHLISEQNIELSSNDKLAFGIGIGVGTLFSLVILWVYYIIIYGIIMSKLNSTLKQLQEIDTDTKN